MNKMSEDEATEKLKQLGIRCKECKFATCENCEINWNEVQAIKTILAELEKKDKIIKNQSYTNKKMHKKLNGYRKLLKLKERHLSKKDKIIDAMTKFISHSDNDEIICKSIKCEDEGCEVCIKQYFERRAKDE